MNIPNNKYEAIYADLKKKIRQGVNTNIKINCLQKPISSWNMTVQETRCDELLRSWVPMALCKAFVAKALSLSTVLT